MSSVIIIDDKQVKRWINKTIQKTPQELEYAIKKTTATTLRNIKTTLPKRTGLLRKSFLSIRLSRFAYRIHSGRYKKIKYADSVEAGSRPHKIKAKRAFFLTIPTSKNQLVSTGARIKTFTVKKFVLLSRDWSTAKFETNIGDILLKREVNHSGNKAGNHFKNIIEPKAFFSLGVNLDKIFTKLGFT